MKAAAPIKGYWARKGGGHVGKDGTLQIKGKRGSNTSRSNSGDNVKRSIAGMLAANAIAHGWLNGIRRTKR